MKKIAIDKKLLYKIYVEENHNLRDTTIILNNEYNLEVSQRTVQRQIKENNFNKDQNKIKETRKQTTLKTYGVENVYQSEEIKNKCKDIKLEKYGNKNYNNTKQQKRTMIEKYGVSCGYNTNKTKETMIEKYGVSHPMLSNKIKEKLIQTNLEKYGVPYYCMTDTCRNANGFTISRINQKFSEKLKENNIEHKLEFVINNESFDFKLLNDNILIEINPTYTHNSTKNCWFNNYEKPPINSNYHYNKSLLAKQNNYHCIHIFDWDDKNKIIEMLKPKEIIAARKCKIKEVSLNETKEFLNKYHLQNSCNNQTIKLGLYYNDKLVQLITFGKPRYNKNYEYELLRLCSKSNYKIIGGSEKIFKYFIETYKPRSIISYCDNSKFSGLVYSKLGFELLSYGKPAKHWFNGKRHITNNLLRQRGFDQLFDTNYGKGTNNEELMKQYGFVEIYDCGQSTYVWQKEN